MTIKSIYLACDHAGLHLKNLLINSLASHEIHDLGTFNEDPVDYPDYAQKLASSMQMDSQNSIGVLICGSGIGMSIAANRYSHIRAALCRDLSDAKLARAHNDANVLVLGGKTTNDGKDILDAFLNTKFESGRHESRKAKINQSLDSLSLLKECDPEVYSSIAKELNRQQNNIELIASENIASLAVLRAQGSILTNKYAEGYVGKRYYGGCEFVDVAEQLAIDRAKKLFNAAYVNVQPHSGSQANQAVFLALLNPGDTYLGMSLDAGGHLTHGCKVNMSGKWFNPVSYGVSRDTGLIDMAEVEDLAIKHKPKVIIAGGSAYPRNIDYLAFRNIADKIGAYFMVDMAHFAGLVAAGVLNNPVEYADVVTSTTHKTLRGPRGGIILTNNEELAKKFNSAVFPGIQGGPLMHVIAAKAIAFGEALKPDFKDYGRQIIENAKALSDSLQARGYKIFTGGTDCHLILVDLRPQGLTGKAADESLENAGLTCNKNAIPFDTEKPFITSGIRLGTPAGTTRGFKTKEFKIIGNLIADVLDALINNGQDNSEIEHSTRLKVEKLCEEFPIYFD